MPEGDEAGAGEADAAAEEIESWVAQTQASLGLVISKPRLLPERLRKPPFRFLFDIAVEVTKQTGFGLAELFGGELQEKPQIPASRDDKVNFLQSWLDVTIMRLPSYADPLGQISVHDIVCGASPENTNFFLQCLASAAWMPAEELAAVEQAAAEKAAAEQAAAEQAAAEQAAAEKAAAEQAAAERAAADKEAEAARAAVVEGAHAAALEEAIQAAEQSPEVLAARAAAEQAAAAAKAAQEAGELDLQKRKAEMEAEFAAAETPEANADRSSQGGTALQDFEALHEEFARTANAWNFDRPATAAPAADSQGAAVEPSAGDDDSDDSDDDSDVDMGQPKEKQPTENQEHMMASTQQFVQTKQQFDKVNDEIMKAADLMANIEDAFDERDASKQKQREAEMQRHAAQEADAETRAQAERDEVEQRKSEKRARKEKKKALKEAEKARLRAEQEAAEEEERKVAIYPMSKTSQMQGARLVSCVGGGAEDEEEQEYEADFEEEPTRTEAVAAGSDDHPRARADNMDACFTDAILGPSPDALGPAASGAYGIDSDVPVASRVSLLEQLKIEMRDTFVSYLCASMPESLLKKYERNELIRCLQMILRELRAIISQHSLEDVQEEDPTSVSEDLRESSANWLEDLTGTSPYTLCQKYDAPEVVDTLQVLAQTCFERITDELGPMLRWAVEGSALHVSPTLAAPKVPSRAPSPARSPSVAGDSPVEAEAGPRPLTSSGALGPGDRGSAALSTRLGTSASRPPPPLAPQPPPVFNAALGPALWEQQSSGMPVTAGPATAGPRAGTGLRVGTGRPGPGTRPGTQNRGHALASR